MRELQGRNAFITGGASGIGFALARALGREDMRVMLADIETSALDAAVAQLTSEGIEARGVQCDVTDRASVQSVAAKTLAALGNVHIICSNAGVIAGGPMELIADGDWHWVMDVSVMGFIHVIQAFLPHLKSHGEGGHIVATVSMSGMLCVPGNGPYNATKFALVALAETLAGELAGTSIGVSALCCSFVRTRLVETSARNRPERYGARTEVPAAAAAQLTALLRSGMDPDEVAEKVVRAIQENEFYIFSNPEMRSVLEARFERILAAYPKS
jgi:NAD(P)-dependent dehydrogenase (short-subunit alcohol dehydrogenase family)